jgi:hypothetical protein
MVSEMGSWMRGCGSEWLGWNRSMARSRRAEEIHEQSTGGRELESMRKWMRIRTLELLIHDMAAEEGGGEGGKLEKMPI